MELKTIKPELIVIAALMMLAIAGAASAAAEVKMIDPTGIRDLVMGWLWFIFNAVVAGGFLWGAIILITSYRSNTPDKRLAGISLCGLCLLAVIVVHVMPWMVQEVENAATTTTVSTINSSST